MVNYNMAKNQNNIETSFKDLNKLKYFKRKKNGYSNCFRVSIVKVFEI